MVSNHRKTKQIPGSRNEVQMVEKDCEKVNLKNDGLTFSKLESICIYCLEIMFVM